MLNISSSFLYTLFNFLKTNNIFQRNVYNRETVIIFFLTSKIFPMFFSFASLSLNLVPFPPINWIYRYLSAVPKLTISFSGFHSFFFFFLFFFFFFFFFFPFGPISIDESRLTLTR